MIKKIIIGVIVGILLIGIPATLYFIKQQQAPTEEEPITPLPTATPVLPEPTLRPATPTPVVSEPSSTPSGTPVATSLPVCSELTLNRAATGAAPLTIRFTANGTDTDGTISEVTFRFGDGEVLELTTGGGIGTNSVSIQSTHTYTKSGTYNAEAVLTDNQGGVSSEGECTQTITVTTGTGASVTGTPVPTQGLPTVTPTRTPTPTVSTSAQTTITPTSPTPTTIEEPGSEVTLGIGAIAMLLLFAGAFIIFIL